MRKDLDALAHVPHQAIAVQEVVDDAHGDEGVVRNPQVADEDKPQQQHGCDEKKARRVLDAQVELDGLMVRVVLSHGAGLP